MAKRRQVAGVKYIKAPSGGYHDASPLAPLSRQCACATGFATTDEIASGGNAAFDGLLDVLSSRQCDDYSGGEVITSATGVAVAGGCCVNGDATVMSQHRAERSARQRDWATPLQREAGGELRW
jgi:hypothetical protein